MDEQADMIAIKNYSTAIADKTHLANLITTLKSELATANALLKAKEEEYLETARQLNQRNIDILDANKRYKMLEKQCAADCETVWSNDAGIISYPVISYDGSFVFLQIKYLENSLKTNSETIQCLEENQEHLKTVSKFYAFFSSSGDCNLSALFLM